MYKTENGTNVYHVLSGHEGKIQQWINQFKIWLRSNKEKELTGSLLDLLSALAVVLGHIQALVDDSGDGFDLRPELLLDSFKVEAIVVRDEVDGQTQVSETSWGRKRRDLSSTPTKTNKR